MDMPMVLAEARAYGTKLAQDIAVEANKKIADERAAFAGTCASMALQTIVTSMVITEFEPGSPEGEAAIRKTYDAVVRDAVERWHKSDLKEMRARGKI